MKIVKSPRKWENQTWGIILATAIIIGATWLFYLYHFYTGR